MQTRRVKIGEVVSDLAQLMIVDPLYVQEFWGSEAFQSGRAYKHKETGKILKRHEFKNFGEIIPEYGKCMGDLRDEGIFEEIELEIKPEYTLSLNAIGHALKKKQSTQINFPNDNEIGLSVHFSVPEGIFEVFAEIAEEDGIEVLKKVSIEIMSDEEALDEINLQKNLRKSFNS